MQEIGRPRPRVYVPVVLSREEVASLLASMPVGPARIVASLLYGASLRLGEALELRVKDVDFSRRVLLLRQAKGFKDRVVMLPATLVGRLRDQLKHSRALWAADRALALAGVALPDALARKLPRAGQSWGWRWVFPAPGLSRDPRSGIRRRHHLYDQLIGRAIAEPTSSARPRRACRARWIGCRSLRRRRQGHRPRRTERESDRRGRARGGQCRSCTSCFWR
jgi:integrase